MAEQQEARRSHRPVRRNYVFRASPWLEAGKSDIAAAYDRADLRGLTRMLARDLGLAPPDVPEDALPLRVTHRPLAEWELDLPGDKPGAAARSARGPKARDAALGMTFASKEQARRFEEASPKLLGRFETAVGDIRIRPALHWGPGRGEGGSFGDLGDALRLIRAGALQAEGLDGAGVKVVIMDQGVDASRLPPGSRFLGGWWRPGVPGAVRPGQAGKDNRHGTMIARNVLAVAPKATILDCPLIPPRITANLPAFLSDALGALVRIRQDIEWLGRIDPGAYRGRWILVNAWSIYDPQGEAVPGEYTRNAGHWLCRAVEEAAEVADIVFAAGNCGQFCPDGRCAEEVIGPGRSILGANSLDSVLTVGAVRADGIWNGYSSQGPGQFPAAGQDRQHKPDLAAPAHFRAPEAAHLLAGGSSAACGIAAGAVAAFRTRWTDATLPSAALFDGLRGSARQPDGNSGWNDRLGHGILDCEAALASLAPVPVA